ncbi:MAG: hypothetical protein ACREIA_21445 [Opitutaceae bacterium]
MNPQIYQILHVGGVILLFALTFSAFASPRPERRKRLLAATGILALVVLVAAFGLIAKLYNNQYTGWMIGKMIIWLAIAAFTGIAFRRPGKATLLSWLTAILGLLAVYLVYFKPVIFGF